MQENKEEASSPMASELSQESQYAIETNNLWRIYPVKNTKQGGIAALRGVNLEGTPGKICCT